jgi:hypothetical protein
MKRTEEKKEGERTYAKSDGPAGRHGLKTDYPLSEKDEIKQAEERMRKAGKKA